LLRPRPETFAAHRGMPRTRLARPQLCRTSPRTSVRPPIEEYDRRAARGLQHREDDPEHLVRRNLDPCSAGLLLSSLTALVQTFRADLSDLRVHVE
jgi:hypothetical protein